MKCMGKKTRTLSIYRMEIKAKGEDPESVGRMELKKTRNKMENIDVGKFCEQLSFLINRKVRERRVRERKRYYYSNAEIRVCLGRIYCARASRFSYMILL